MKPPRAQSLLRQVMKQPALVLWAMWLLLIPFYVAPSGMPQPSNAILVLLVPVTLNGWNGRLPPEARKPLRTLIFFTLWVGLVNLLWAVILWSWGLDAIFTLYYLFNLLVFFVGLVLYRRFGETLLLLTVRVVFAVVMLQVALSFVFATGRGRDSLFFNNANQLGFYSLIAACIMAVGQKRAKFPLVLATIGLLGCGYLALMSASRAAAGGIVILGLLLLAANPRVVIVGSILVTVIALVGPVANRFENLQTRVEKDRTSQKNFFEERHYDRVWKFKEHLLLGAGEGNVDRFTELGYGEIHSSFATVLFSYGVLGVILAARFFWSLIGGSSVRTALMLIPALSYMAAHQGLRFTMLWVLLGVMVMLRGMPPPAPARRT